MKKDFVPYEQALLLKELGFDEPCFGSYVKLTETQNTFFMNDVVSEIDRETPLHKSLITKAPLYQQAFRWFREKYGLEGVIQQAKDFTWYRWEISQYNEDGKKYVADWYEYKTYEEAELECLDRLIKIVKNK